MVKQIKQHLQGNLWKLTELGFSSHVVSAGVRWNAHEGGASEINGTERARKSERERGRFKTMSEKCASHLALSLPCDLMKFIFLYLDRKATSWLLVLKRNERIPG